MPKILTHRKSCRFCNSRNIKPVLRFEQTPLNVLTDHATNESLIEERQPLILSVCENCKLVQLLDITSPEILHRNPSDRIDPSPATLDHFKAYARTAAETAKLEKDDLVIDIGCGNRALLDEFQRLGMRTIGVDPVVTADDNHYGEFFTPALAGIIADKHGKASLVTANYVMGSVDNMHAFMAGVRHLLKPEGLFIAEEPYLADVIEQSMFDTINHKRLSFFTASPLNLFLKTIHMHLINTQRIPFRRGSVRMTIQRSDGHRVIAPELNEFIDQENASGLYSVDRLNNFADQIEALKNSFRKSIADIKNNGGTIAGYGASGRTLTMILECGWQTGVIDFIVDGKQHEEGVLLSGTDIPVFSMHALSQRKPTHLFIFSYYDADYIIEQNEEFAAQGGKFIVPFPGIEIV